MSDVPGSSEWPIKTLEDVALVNPPGRDTVTDDETQITFVPMGAMSEETGEVDYSEIRTFGEVKKGYTRFRDNDVLFAKITPCMENGKAAVVEGLSNGIGCGSTEFHVVRCFDELLPKFAWYFLIQKRFRHAAERQMQGAVGQKRVPPNVLKQALLPVPDLNSQQRTIDRIDQLFSRIDEGERALRKVETLVERYRQSVLKAAVTGELTRDWRAANRERLAAEGDTGQALLDRILTARREAWETAELEKLTAKGKPPKTDAWKAKYKEPVAPDTDGLPELPEGWVWASLEQISSAEAPIAYGVLQPGPDIEHGVPMVRVCDMQATRTKLDGLKRIAPDIAAKYPRTELQGGELLISVVGTIGRISIASEELAGANVARAVSVIRLVEADLIEWSVLALDNLKSNQRLVAAAREVARKTLNLEQLRSFAVPVPPIGEAAQATMIFSEKLAELDASHRAVLAASNRSAAIKSAVLSAAFSGRLITENI